MHSTTSTHHTLGELQASISELPKDGALQVGEEYTLEIQVPSTRSLSDKTLQVEVCLSALDFEIDGAPMETILPSKETTYDKHGMKPVYFKIKAIGEVTALQREMTVLIYGIRNKPNGEFFRRELIRSSTFSVAIAPGVLHLASEEFGSGI